MTPSRDGQVTGSVSRASTASVARAVSISADRCRADSGRGGGNGSSRIARGSATVFSSGAAWQNGVAANPHVAARASVPPARIVRYGTSDSYSSPRTAGAASMASMASTRNASRDGALPLASSSSASESSADAVSSASSGGSASASTPASGRPSSPNESISDAFGCRRTSHRAMSSVSVAVTALPGMPVPASDRSAAAGNADASSSTRASACAAAWWRVGVSGYASMNWSVSRKSSSTRGRSMAHATA